MQAARKRTRKRKGGARINMKIEKCKNKDRNKYKEWGANESEDG